MKSVSLDDVTTTLSLASMAALDRICPQSKLDAVVRRCAELHVTLRGSKTSELQKSSLAEELGVNLEDLERDFLAGVYQEMIYTLREHWRSGWRPEIQLRGEGHLESALSAGRGAVLWMFPCTYGGLVAKKILHSEGFDVATLASHIHPYSGTRFGKKFLNPVRTDVEDRYIVERVLLRPNKEAVAMRRVMQLLAENKLVEIAAIGVSDSPARFSFLGGTLNLALGAPTIATMARAALIPCFTVPTASEEFEVSIEQALSSNLGGGPRDAAIHLAREYVPLLRRYVAKTPHVWRGWFTRSNWAPRS